MPEEEDLRKELREILKDADFPVSKASELIPAFPNGTSTKLETSDFSMSIIELYFKLDPDFPYENMESLVDDIIEGLKNERIL